MKPLLTIFALVAGMAASAASPKHYVFAPLPDDSATTNAVAPPVSAPAQKSASVFSPTPVLPAVVESNPPPTMTVETKPKPKLEQFIFEPLPLMTNSAPATNSAAIYELIKKIPTPPSSAPKPMIQNPAPLAVKTNPPPALKTNAPPVLPPPVFTPKPKPAPVETPPVAKTNSLPPVDGKHAALEKLMAEHAAKIAFERHVFAPLPDEVEFQRALAAPAAVATNAVPVPVAAPAPAPKKEIAPAKMAVQKPVEKAAAKKSSKLDASKARLIVSASQEFYGTVAAVDARGRFVVLNFPLGQMPGADAVLPVFRHGVKVGEVKVTGPQRDDNTMADVLSGDLQADDDVRY